MNSNSTREFLFSDEFCRQYEREWKKYNSDVDAAIELVKTIEDAERTRVSKEEGAYEALGNFGAFI